MAVLTTKRGERADDGFTLIELFVVVAVIGVLIAIGIPALLGAKGRAEDTRAQSAVVQGVKTAKTYYTDRQEYTDDPLALRALEPSLKFTQFTTVTDINGDAQVLGKVYVRNDTPEQVTLVSKSAEGVCYWIRADGSLTYYARNECQGEPPTFQSGGW